MGPTSRHANIYSPLDPANHEIRLLLIQPSHDFSAPISIDLLTVSLKDKPDYQALSYTWSAVLASEDVILCGCRRTITANLYAALHCLRRSSETRIMWIDALCIDQANMEERASQIALMGQVYSAAREGLIWLGSNLSNTPRENGHVISVLENSKSFEWITQNAHDLATCEDLSEPEDQALAAFAILYILSIDEHWENKRIFTLCDDRRYHVSTKYLAAWSAFLKLLQVSWWTRTWVVQEFVLPPSTQLIAGGASVPGHLITDFCLSYMNHLSPGNCCHISVCWTMTQQVWNDIVQVRLTSWSYHLLSLAYQAVSKGNINSGSALRHALWMLRPRQATDHRDKVYGTLGMLPRGAVENSLTLLEPDYSKTVAQTYADCTNFIMKSERNFTALLGPRLKRVGFPSWAPGILPERDEGDVLFFDNIARRISCSHMFNADGGQEFYFDAVETELRLRGIHVDTVKQVVAPYREGNEHRTLVECERIALGEESTSTDSTLPNLDYPSVTPGTAENETTISREEAFWRTMLRDILIDYSNSPNDRRLRSSDTECWRLLRTWLASTSDPTQYTPMSSHPDFAHLRKSFFVACQFQHFFTTENGHFALGYEPLVGDEIWIIAGAPVPFVLRRTTSRNRDTYAMIGDCYVHGLMDGEAMRKHDSIDFRDIVLL